MKMTNLDRVKLGLEIFTGVGTDRILAEIIKANVPKGNVFQQVAVFTARMGLGIAISQATTRVINSNIDDLAEAVKKARTEIQAANEANNQ